MISVLYVDDEPDLLELTKIYLEDTGKFAVATAASASEAIGRVQETTYDVIVSDYEMPGTDGIEFLKTIRSKGDPTPFIIFTGKGREREVIQAINWGADFYLQKGGDPVSQFADLEHKILQATKFHRDERALRESETRFRALVENASEVIMILNHTGQIVFSTPALERMLGHSIDFILGKDPLEFVHPDDLEMVKRELGRVCEGTNSGNPIEFRIRKADGSYSWAEGMGKNMIGIAGVDGIVITIRLIEERKEAEKVIRENEERWRQLFEHSLAVMILIEPDTGRILAANSAAATFYGYTRAELCTMRIDDINQLSSREIEQARRKVTRREQNCFTFPHRLSDGRIRTVEVYSSPVEINGKLNIFAIVHDITDRIRAEKVLKESEENFRTLLEHMPDLILVHHQGKILYVNPAMIQSMGFLPEEVVGRSILDYIPLEYHHRVAASIRKRDSSHPPDPYGIEIVSKRGERRAVIVRGTRIEFGGSPAILNVLTDITDQKRAEATLRESEARYSSLFDRNHSISLLIDPDTGKIMEANDAACRYYGFSREELLAKGIFDLNRLPREKVVQDLVQAKNEHEKHFYSTHYLASGEKRNVEIYSGPITLQEKPLFYSIIHDITDRKVAELALRKSEAQLQAIIQSSPIPKFVIDRHHRVISWNRALEETTGIKAGEILGTNRHWQAFYDAERPCLADLLLEGSIDRFPELYAGICQKSPIVEEGYEGTDFFPRLGTRGRWLTFVAAPIRDNDGTVIGAVETLEDITPLKEVESSLRASEQRYHNIVEDQTEFICRFLPDGTHMFVNDAYARYFGKTREELTGKIFLSNIHPDDRKKVKEFFVSLSPEHPVGFVEHRIIMPNSEVRWQRWSDRAIFDKAGSLIGYQSVGRDITEQKVADEALQHANQQLKILTSITRHDILNKVTILRGYLALAQSRSSDPAVAKYLKNLESATRDIQDQIEFTRMYQDLGGQKPQWQDLKHILDSQHFSGALSWSFDGTRVQVLADPMFERVFFNLLDNSVRHGQHVTNINVSSKESDEGLTIFWEDDGVGIPQEEKDMIFDRGYGKNTGLGLFLVKEILAITGMSIRETGEPGRGARFEISVPRGKFRKGA